MSESGRERLRRAVWALDVMGSVRELGDLCIADRVPEPSHAVAHH